MTLTVADTLPFWSRRARPKPAPAGTRPRRDPAQALEIGRSRLLVTAFVFGLAFLAVAGRLIDLTVLRGGNEPRLSGAALADAARPERGEIRDRDGRVLAISLRVASLYADPTQVANPEQAIMRLARVLPTIDVDRVSTALESERRFAWIHRGLTPRQQNEINRLGIPGLSFQAESRRIYPLGALTAHIVGYTDIDGHGLAGVERSMDERLTTTGEPVTLSIDLGVQTVLRAELQAAVSEFTAIGGAGLVMDANNGEILGMVSLPDFDPDRPGTVPPETRFNRTTLGVYEMGSTFKIFTVAIALDAGVTRITGGYDASRPIQIGRFTINDYHGQGRWLTVPEIFMYSSNIGAAHMAQATGTARQQAYLRRLGLLDPAPVEVPEVGAPLVPRPWREINTMTISFGHGLSVSPVQLAAAVAATVNGGILHPPTLMRRDPDAPVPGTRVLSAETSAQMRRLFRLVVERGTGRNADAPGYLVGGKTGSAEKSHGRGYSRRALLSSFVGAFPINQPRYVVLVILDEPHGNQHSHGYATGGWVAAPAVRRIVEQIGPMLGVPPVNADDPEIRQAVQIDPGRGGRGGGSGQVAAMAHDR